MTEGVAARSDNPGASPSVRGLWALGFVALSLVALVAVPTYFGQRLGVVQTRIIDVLEPAARLSSNLVLVKARQMARVEGFLLTGDRSFRAPYIAAIAEEDSVVARLAVLARDLDRDVFEAMARYNAESNDWDFENQRIFELGVDETAGDRVRSGRGLSMARWQARGVLITLIFRLQWRLARRRRERGDRGLSVDRSGLWCDGSNLLSKDGTNQEPEDSPGNERRKGMPDELVKRLEIGACGVDCCRG